MTDQELWNKLHRSQAKRRLELAAERCKKAYQTWTLVTSQDVQPVVNNN